MSSAGRQIDRRLKLTPGCCCEEFKPKSREFAYKFKRLEFISGNEKKKNKREENSFLKKLKNEEMNGTRNWLNGGNIINESGIDHDTAIGLRDRDPCRRDLETDKRDRSGKLPNKSRSVAE